jgi:hypothetical protein
MFIFLVFEGSKQMYLDDRKSTRTFCCDFWYVLLCILSFDERDAPILYLNCNFVHSLDPDETHIHSTYPLV